MTLRVCLLRLVDALEICGRRMDAVSVAAARAALATWTERPRLADDPALVADVKYWGPPGTREADAKAILHAIEAHLYGKERT